MVNLRGAGGHCHAEYSLADNGLITAYEASTVYDALKAVFEALGKTNKAEKEVTDIMGGEILEFSADKLFNAGEAKGKAEGIVEGKAERSQEIYERMIAENIPAEQARKIAFG